MAIQKHNSLKRRLVIGISLFSIILGCCLIYAAYRISLHEINGILDAQMKNLAERVATHEPSPLQSQFNVDNRYHEEDLFVDVWSYHENNYIVNSKNLLVPPVKEPGFYTHEAGDEVWYSYVIPVQKYQIQVSQQEVVRQRLALELAGSMFIPYFLFMPLFLWGLYWVIGRSLKPLNDFKKELSRRNAGDLTLIHLDDYPLEIVPTIDEMNHLFERISLSQQKQRQFIADAAHELRTPITALNLQIQILLRQFPSSEPLRNLSKGLIRIQHLVSQLLNLAKQDASMPELGRKTDFSVNQVAVNCVEQLIHLAMQKEIDIGMVRQDNVFMTSREPAVHSIIYNLIDNAIKYTPKQGIINVSVFQQNKQVVIQIEDSGAGIDPELYNKITKRFYRVQQHVEIGSGLGLSIVDTAIQRLGGKLQFSKSDTLGGLQVNVELPL